MDVRAAVTTPLSPTPAEEASARAAAARHGLPYVARGRSSLAAALAGAGADAALVLSAKAAVLSLGGLAWRWSPGLGALRAKRARARLPGPARDPTARDPFLEAAGIREGDAVLDCTLGLGADALVAAVAAGPSGRVEGVEASPLLAAWVAEGLARLADPAAARVLVRCDDHAAVLAAAPLRSFDVVVFDPMFRHARAEPAGFDLPFSQEIMGDALGLSVPHLNRMLSQLRFEGLVTVVTRRVEFPDLQAIHQRAQFQPLNFTRIPAPV